MEEGGEPGRGAWGGTPPLPTLVAPDTDEPAPAACTLLWSPLTCPLDTEREELHLAPPGNHGSEERQKGLPLISSEVGTMKNKPRSLADGH